MVSIPSNWEVSVVAVNRFDAFCIARHWPFIETPGQRDFGKDGTVDLSDQDEITGQTFAVQVKGGTSYRRSDHYIVPVGTHGRAWAESTLPVVGIVWDPDDENLRWVNLTAALRDDGTLTEVPVPPGASLSSEVQVQAMVTSARATFSWGHLPAGLGSRDLRDQSDAVWDCFSIGRRNPAGLIALRRCFLSLGTGPRLEALAALAHCTPHPDIFWTPHNWLPPPVKAQVALEMRWGEAEIITMLSLIDDEEGCRRGGVGQSVWMLLREDPDCSAKLIAIAETTSAHMPWVASWAAAIGLRETGDAAVDAWKQAVERTPALGSVPLADQISEALIDRGWIDLD